MTKIYRLIEDNREIVADEAFMTSNYHPSQYEYVREVESQVKTSWKITRLAFRNRFTPAEKIALYTAADTNVAIKVYLDDVNAATFIDLTRPDTVVGVQALEALTIIGAGRANEILTTPPTSEEEYRE